MTIPRSDNWAERDSSNWVWLAEITHPLLDTPIRVAVNTSDVTYGGEVYAKGSLSLVPPDFTDGQQSARIRVANVNRKAGLAIQRMVTPCELTLALVNADDPDTGAVTWSPMLIANAVGNAVEITGEFVSRFNANDAFPKQRAIKAIAPGLFF